MKKLIYIYCISFSAITAHAQSPYTGGDGSGYHINQTSATNCTMYFGGNADGAVSNLSALTVCPPYFGGNGDGYDMDSATCSISLPLKLLEFYAEKESHRNVLHWKIADGFNVKQFTIERSVDGILFTPIGTVAGSVNYDHPYLFIDNTPGPDINFYRLRITEWDNTVSYSKTLVIKNLPTSLLSLYPNPANTSATLYYYSSQTGITRFTLYQYDGRMIMTKNLNLKKGANYINVDFQNVIDGLYFIRIGESGTPVKVIVQKG